MQYMDSTRSVAHHFDANAESCELLLHICFFIRSSQTWPIGSPTYCLFFARLITLPICGLHLQCILRTIREVNGQVFLFPHIPSPFLISLALSPRFLITFLSAKCLCSAIVWSIGLILLFRLIPNCRFSSVSSIAKIVRWSRWQGYTFI